MGNSQVGALKNAILEDNQSVLKEFIDNEETKSLLEHKLNRKGDTALLLCARQGRLKLLQMLVDGGCNLQASNNEGNNALDIALQLLLPDDGDILHHHFCPYSCAESEHTFQFTDLIRYLLRKQLRGKSLHRLILYSMNNSEVISDLIELLPDLTTLDYRIAGLLLQITVWNNQHENLLTLLQNGANIDDFWRAAFMPRIQPSQHFRPVHWHVKSEEEGEYEINLPPDSDALQNLKLALVQDWRADWNDGENPAAQFRAALQLTPDGAVYFIRASNSSVLLSNVMTDINKYRPVSCSGPDLRNSQLFDYLITADYAISSEEWVHIELKFGIGWKQYEEYLSKVKSLRHICRATIRRRSRINVFYTMKHLPNVPNSLKEYITISTPLI